MATACLIHPAKLDFPAATQDLSALSGTETRLRLTAKVKGFELLPDFSELRTLWCFGIDASRLDVIQRCYRLEALYIDGLRCTDLDGLGRLSKLDVLSINGATKVDSLDWLARLPPLTQLRLEHLPKVRNLGALRFQPHLHVLEASGSMWTRMTVESFGPVGELSDLQALYLMNIQAADVSLRPLGRLEKLAELSIAGFYKWQEFARLSAALRDTRCAWFAPYLILEGQRCESCGADLVVMTGKGKPTVCPECRRDTAFRTTRLTKRNCTPLTICPSGVVADEVSHVSMNCRSVKLGCVPARGELNTLREIVADYIARHRIGAQRELRYIAVQWPGAPARVSAPRMLELVRGEAHRRQTAAGCAVG